MSDKNKSYFKKLREDNPTAYLLICLYCCTVIIYTIIYIVFFGDHKQLLELNSFGDFLAGIFSPLAFFFLYIGYKQNTKALEIQAEELQKSTEALQYQVEEMKKSVEEQQKAFKFQEVQEESKHFSVMPSLSYKSKDFRLYDTQNTIYDENGNHEDFEIEECADFDFTITNKGGSARHFTMIDIPTNVINYSEFEIIKDIPTTITIHLKESEIDILKREGSLKVDMLIQYYNLYGKAYQQKIRFSYSQDREQGFYYVTTYTYLSEES